MKHSLHTLAFLAVGLFAILPSAARSQDVRTQLLDRGASVEFANQVAESLINWSVSALMWHVLPTLSGWGKTHGERKKGEIQKSK